MPPRRYDEDEAAGIFRRAAELEQRAPRAMTTGEGMTLAELQEIGREAGLDPALVARAALLPDEPGARTTRRLLGLPVGVGHAASLGRRMSDDEWERLVVDLRETFDARGTVRVDGGLRQWSNGNLQVLVEPVADGDRIRLRTVHAQARSLVGLGVAFAGTGAIVGLVNLATAGQALAAGTAGTMLLGGFGAALVAWGAVRLPGWARVRRAQMEAVAERLSERPRTGA